MSRPGWDQHWMEAAALAAQMSTCASGRKVGAVFVRDKRLLATGFNGVPCGYPHPASCKRRDLGVPSGQQLELCACAHAEANGIANAARHGVKLEGATCYVTTQPCGACMGALANVGITRVIYAGAYPDPRSQDIARYAGIELLECDGQGNAHPPQAASEGGGEAGCSSCSNP
ncbi:deoxycytidylate deaminase [Magnetofaba australis]|uniref:deoxycytidylate deaminase n=1 Tax=Magnetofaba australis TaxID=1472297 RepID=UPI000A19EFF2|nr:dCMP deaminase family protein [Magnetofaba australis]